MEKWLSRGEEELLCSNPPNKYHSNKVQNLIKKYPKNMHKKVVPAARRWFVFTPLVYNGGGHGRPTLLRVPKKRKKNVFYTRNGKNSINFAFKSTKSVEMIVFGGYFLKIIAKKNSRLAALRTYASDLRHWYGIFFFSEIGFLYASKNMHKD